MRRGLRSIFMSAMNFIFILSFLLISLWNVSCNGLQISPLLSTVVDACQRGCHEIRKVQNQRIKTMETTGSSDGLSFVELKDELDPRSVFTEADGAAQRVITESLRAAWGEQLRIIGEEDDENVKIKSATTIKPLQQDMFEDDIPFDATDPIDISKITIYVDPLDGTREFVEGRLENCQVLVGIAIDGEAVAGAIGIPFPDGSDDLSVDPTIVYRLAEYEMAGVFGTPLKRGQIPLPKHRDSLDYPRPHIATGDSTADVMEACRRATIYRFGGSNVIYGGAGNKILAAALREVACTIQHKVGGPWDLCAPEAVLKAMGGKMTDLFGNKIDIYRLDYDTNRCNERGYIATPQATDKFSRLHDALVETMLELPEVQEYQKEVGVITTNKE